MGVKHINRLVQKAKNGADLTPEAWVYREADGHYLIYYFIGGRAVSDPLRGAGAADFLRTIKTEIIPFVEREYRADPADGLRLTGAIILNAVKCLPPANKPIPEEIATCRNYLEAGFAALPGVRVVVALGQIAHAAACRAIGLKPGAAKFGHGSEWAAADGRVLLSSYHCSRYNQNTGRLNARMFEDVFERALRLEPVE